MRLPRFRAATACVALALLSASCSTSAADQRQVEVAARGAEVMPFDLNETTHVFTDTPTGGIQEVRADDPEDAENIGLVQSHLEDEAARFASGDFSDPEEIHGPDMPGLSTLKARLTRSRSFLS